MDFAAAFFGHRQWTADPVKDDDWVYADLKECAGENRPLFFSVRHEALQQAPLPSLDAGQAGPAAPAAPVDVAGGCARSSFSETGKMDEPRPASPRAALTPRQPTAAASTPREPTTVVSAPGEPIAVVLTPRR